MSTVDHYLKNVNKLVPQNMHLILVIKVNPVLLYGPIASKGTDRNTCSVSITDLRIKSCLSQFCIVADRGMVSAENVREGVKKGAG